jgi:hypothetical protein
VLSHYLNVQLGFYPTLELVEDELVVEIVHLRMTYLDVVYEFRQVAVRELGVVQLDIQTLDQLDHPSHQS